MGEHHYAPVPIIDRVAAVLDIVMETPDGVRPGELLRAEGIPKMTLYRLLTVMTEHEFLEYQPESGRYFMGERFAAAYASIDERNAYLRKAAVPYLERLVRQCRRP